VWAAVAVALALVVGGAIRAAPSAEPGDVIDERLMVALGEAKSLHDKAKIYLGDGNTHDAVATLRQILSVQFPLTSPEAEDVRNDARALLAKLLAEQGLLDEAMVIVDEGLAAANRESFFVANLHAVKGRLHHARSQEFADPSGPDAIAEKRRAIDELDRAIQIDEEIQKRLARDHARVRGNGGCCDAGGSGPAWAAVLVVLWLARRRRRS
jgi:uncharacterized protein (TIGR03382 family)